VSTVEDAKLVGMARTAGYASSSANLTTHLTSKRHLEARELDCLEEAQPVPDLKAKTSDSGRISNLLQLIILTMLSFSTAAFSCHGGHIPGS
jgi:hypothetical protein